MPGPCPGDAPDAPDLLEARSTLGRLASAKAGFAAALVRQGLYPSGGPSPAITTDALKVAERAVSWPAVQTALLPRR